MTDPAGTGGAGAADRLSRRRLVPAGLVCVGLGLVAALQTWASGTAADVVLGRVSVSGSGQQLAPGVVGAALVAAAGLVAASISGRILRLVSAIATALAGLLGVAASLAAARDPVGALRAVAGTAVTRTDTVITDPVTTVWPWVAALAAAATAVIGALVVIGGRHWGTPGSRYETPAGRGRDSAQGSAPDSARVSEAVSGPGSSLGADVTDAWDRLTDGEDPTIGPPGPIPPNR